MRHGDTERKTRRSRRRRRQRIKTKIKRNKICGCCPKAFSHHSKTWMMKGAGEDDGVRKRRPRQARQEGSDMTSPCGRLLYMASCVTVSLTMTCSPDGSVCVWLVTKVRCLERIMLRFVSAFSARSSAASSSRWNLRTRVRFV